MFKVGQKVWCVMYGEGVVTKILNNNTQFRVEVHFGEIPEYCTLGGKYRLEGLQTLFPYPVEIIKKITKPSINWEHVAPEFKYLAEDSDGSAFLYEEEPYVATDATDWSAQSNGVVEANGFASYVKGTCDWKDSLIKRPEVQ